MNRNKRFAISSVEIERYKNERYAWIYLHPLPPLSENADTAAEFAVALRALEGCRRAVSSGDDLDLTYEFADGLSFRFAFDGIHGMVIECAARDAEAVKRLLTPLCTVSFEP